MPEFPPLTPDFCLRMVISASPFPSRFNDGDDPTVTNLFDLGVATPTDGAFFAHAVKNRIVPWHIDVSSIASSPDTTLIGAANSIQVGAFKG